MIDNVFINKYGYYANMGMTRDSGADTASVVKIAYACSAERLKSKGADNDKWIYNVQKLIFSDIF